MASFEARLKRLEQRVEPSDGDLASTIITARGSEPIMTVSEAEHIAANHKEGSLLRRIAEARLRVGAVRAKAVS